MPVDIDADTALVDHHCAVVLACLPVPEPELALGVTRGQELAIWGKLESAGVARGQVPRELLLSVHLEVALAVIDDYLVVHGLACEILHVWVHRSGGHCMHIWLTDVLSNDWDAELPHVHLLVISRGDEAAPILDERDRVDGTKMLFVLLHDLFRVRVELEDLLV